MLSLYYPNEIIKIFENSTISNNLIQYAEDLYECIDNDDFDDGYNGLIAVGGGGGGATSQRAAINKDNSGDSTPYTFGAQTNSGAGGGDNGGDLATQLYYPSDAAQKWASSYYGTFEYTNLIAKNGYMTPNLEAGTQTSGYKKGIGELNGSLTYFSVRPVGQ